MSEIRLISPILDDFDIGGSISEHDGVRCYPAMRKETTDRYIVKTVSIPASQTQLDALLLTGAYTDAASALTYFKELADATVEELNILQSLSQQDGFLSYENWQVAAKEDSVGFDVCMLGTYKYPLRKFFQHQPMTHLSAVNLGLDICDALSACRQAGYLYVDLKPNNIYVLDDNTFHIGDIGFLQLSSLKYATLPSKYCNQYTAPEGLDAFSALHETIDVYALGLILYQAYNGGELPFVGKEAPAEKFPSPAYADYEMAEIILKACDPDPNARWQNPAEMRQALVSYMQRNGANNTPIVPPVIQFRDEEVIEEPFEEESEDILTDDIDMTDIDLNNIPKIDDVSEGSAESVTEDSKEESIDDVTGFDSHSNDETYPENNLTEVSYEEISDELNEILSQADELVAHPVPAPVVAPDAFELPEIPQPELELPVTEISEDATEEAARVESAEEVAVLDIDPEVAKEHITLQEEDIDNVNDGGEYEDYVEEPLYNPAPTFKRKLINWILGVVIFLLIAAIVAVGVFYYKTIYLLPIHSITVNGSESSMVVQIDTDIDETLLSVICSDSHGNQISAPVVNGNATFANLIPDTAYNVQILVDGFHRLTGQTAASYSTPAQTNIVQFSAVTGSENGSVILGFTLEGPDTGNWKITYSAEDEEPQTVDVLSHMVTLNDLTVGKEYTFTLVPGDDMYVTGITETTFTASNLIYAKDVMIISCVDNQLTAVWSAPEDTTVESWTVRCYNDAGYNQTKIISETMAIFDDVDPSTSYTVEVTAFGMSVSERAYMVANAITISNFTAITENPGILQLTWDSNVGVPTDGWVLSYAIDGSDVQEAVVCIDNNTLITPVVPGATYNFELKQANGNPVLTLPLSCDIPESQDFSGYGLNRSMMDFQLCVRPDSDTWNWGDVAEEDRVNTFNVGQQIGLVGEALDDYGNSEDMITILFVIRDSSGKFISFSSTEISWDDIWYQSHTAMDIPQIPTVAGEYTISIYFNNKFVSQKNLKIQ